MHASYEELLEHGGVSVGILRVHPSEGDWSLGTDWTWSGTLRVRDEVAELKGVNNAPDRAELKALLNYFLKFKNLKEVHYEIKGRYIVHYLGKNKFRG